MQIPIKNSENYSIFIDFSLFYFIYLGIKKLFVWIKKKMHRSVNYYIPKLFIFNLKKHACS